ncbi:MAG: hypothetical protein RIS76_3360 [Verrucomicrobiota bacterium]|jgi:ribose transport system ATP-binding protein
MTPLLQIEAVGKSFFGVPVLRNVSLNVAEGRIVGLVGENGAGKSTLMNLLGGTLQPDAGSLRFRGVPYSPKNPGDARSAGIGFVHQELNLFPNLSIAENLFLTNFPILGNVGGPSQRWEISLPGIDRQRLQMGARQLLNQVGLNLDPNTPVAMLSTGERQLVEIAHALSFHPRLMILDEPTTSLSFTERERLFGQVRELREDGYSFIFISHTLGDVLRLCDDVVVLRDGEVVGQGPATGFNPARLISLMVGRELTRLFPKRGSPEPLDRTATAPLLEARSLSQPGVARDLSFTLHRGEVLGLSGLMGAGRTELARILFGLEPHQTGTIHLKGQPLTGSPRRRIQRRLAFLTESRRDDGLCLEASVADNMALVTLPDHTRNPLRLLDVRRLGAALSAIREAVRIQPRVNNEQPVKTLSGGNQQKVVLAKWLLAEPEVLLLDEPTRGIDVGAKSEIYQLVRDLADRGAGILVISSDLEELTGLCDRILVMSRGRLTGNFPGPDFDRERILSAALPT